MDAIRVLVVEDDPVLKPIYTGAFYAVDPDIELDWKRSVDDVLQAIELDGDYLKSFSLVIMDLILPGKTTGIEFLRVLRTERPHLSVLITTGMTYEEVVKAAGKEFMTPLYLHKPIVPGALMDAVRRILKS